jgi:2-polyprenyl-3-methyl-5-hydroxy-6-metoxy-1,4-benzoquinol methylase
MSFSAIPHPINSKSWWEEYHSKYWDACHGSSQTAHFMERLLKGLNPAEWEFLKGGNLDILDWGCAFGEGVVCLARAFAGCSVVGLDYSEQAIEVARSRYPRLEFIQNSEGSIPRAFDVIVTSNCLEHFADPLAIVSNHLLCCRDLYIALVPYREEPL